MDVVNERAYCLIVASFLDEDDVAVTPTSVTYRLDDVRSGLTIIAATTVNPGDTYLNISVTSAQNRIIDSNLNFERRVLTVEFDYGASKHGTSEYEYSVKNLQKVV